jgi:hypothetical protein
VTLVGGGLLGVVCVEEGGLVVLRTRSCEFHCAMQSAISVALANWGVLLAFAVGRMVDGRTFGVHVAFACPGVRTTLDLRALAETLVLGFNGVAESLDGIAVGLADGSGFRSAGVLKALFIGLLLCGIDGGPVVVPKGRFGAVGIVSFLGGLSSVFSFTELNISVRGFAGVHTAPERSGSFTFLDAVGCFGVMSILALTVLIDEVVEFD